MSTVVVVLIVVAMACSALSIAGIVAIWWFWSDIFPQPSPSSQPPSSQPPSSQPPPFAATTPIGNFDVGSVDAPIPKAVLPIKDGKTFRGKPILGTFHDCVVWRLDKDRIIKRLNELRAMFGQRGKPPARWGDAVMEERIMALSQRGYQGGHLDITEGEGGAENLTPTHTPTDTLTATDIVIGVIEGMVGESQFVPRGMWQDPGADPAQKDCTAGGVFRCTGHFLNFINAGSVRMVAGLGTKEGTPNLCIFQFSTDPDVKYDDDDGFLPNDIPAWQKYFRDKEPTACGSTPERRSVSLSLCESPLL